MDRERPLINMVSMIDATFLLLSFFLVTSGAAMLEGRLTGALGTAAGAKGDLQAVVVEVMDTSHTTLPCWNSCDTCVSDTWNPRYTITSCGGSLSSAQSTMRAKSAHGSTSEGSLERMALLKR
jgi:hypothetical protein